MMNYRKRIDWSGWPRGKRPDWGERKKRQLDRMAAQMREKYWNKPGMWRREQDATSAGQRAQGKTASHE